MGGTPFEADTPLEEATPGDDWRMEVAVPEEGLGTPPLLGDETGTEALGTPELLYGGGVPADDGVEDAAPGLVYWLGGDAEFGGAPLLVGTDRDGETTGDETGRLKLGTGGMSLEELSPP